MKKAVLFSLTTAFLGFSQATTQAGNLATPLGSLPLVQATTPANDALTFEETGVRLFALACSQHLARRMQEEGYADFAFIPPGATCMNAFKPENALPLPEFLNSAVIVPGRDAQSVDIRLSSQSNTRYLLHLFLGWSGSFDRLP